MVPWQIWLIVAGVCFVIEIFTVGFLVFWFAIAALIVCVLSLFIDSLIIQTTLFIILSALLILLTRPFAKKITKNDTAITNTKRIIGKTAIVKKEISKHQGGQVKINGELWTAILPDDINSNIPEGSTVIVNSIDGVKLIVTPVNVITNSKN